MKCVDCRAYLIISYESRQLWRLVTEQSDTFIKNDKLNSCKSL